MKKYIFGLSLLTLLAGACTDDWDQHYQAEVHGDGTLWEAISKQGNMNNFKHLLEATGYEKVLNGSQVFTIFAPTDEAFSSAECSELIASYQEQKSRGVREEYNTVIKEFVMNHIALYNYSVSSYTNDSIIMMNGKYHVMGKDNIAGSHYVTSNRLSTNGVLFTLDKKVDFVPNIYEYLEKDADLDSVSRFFHKYDVFEFNPDASVPGEIVNGKIQYLDSVTDLTNDLFRYLAEINREDSAFIALLPSNELWAQQVERNKDFFVYDDKVEMRDSLSYIFPRLQIIEGSFFSRSNNPEDSLKSMITTTYARLVEAGKGHSYLWPSEGWKYYFATLKEGESAKYTDVAYFTSDQNIGDYLFEGAEQKSCSNGAIYKECQDWKLANSLFNCYSTIEMEAESGMTLDSVYSNNTRPLSYNKVRDDNPLYSDVSQQGFVEIAPKAAAQVNALFDFYNVLSNVEYEIFVVTVPPTASDTLADPLMTRFQTELMWNKQNGTVDKVKIPSKSTAYFEASGEKVDTISLGKYIFPTCSYGLDKPQVKLLVKGYTNPSLVNAGTHTRTIRIDKFVLKPTVPTTTVE